MPILFIAILAVWLANPAAVICATNDVQQSGSYSNFQVQQRGTSILFNVTAENARITADIYTLSGKHVGTAIDRVLSRGNYSFHPLGTSNLSKQTYLVRLSDGVHSAFVRMLNVGNEGTLGLRVLTELSARLAKIAADTPTTICTGVFQFPNACPGRIITVKKMHDPSIHGTRIVTDATDIPDMTALENLRNKEWQLLKAKYGCLGQSLRAKISSSSNLDDMVAVKIYPKMPPFTYPGKTAPLAVLKAKSLEAANLEPLVSMDTIVNRYQAFGNFAKADKLNATGHIKVRDLANLMHDDDIGSINEDIPKTPCANVLPFSTFATEAWVSGLPTSCQGNNVHAATFEWGLLSSFITCKGLGSNGGVLETTASRDDHTEMCFTCLLNAAPKAKFYHHISTTYFQPADINFLINNSIETVSCSYPRTSDANDPEMMTMDDFAYRFPYPVFCDPADNNAINSNGQQTYYYVNWGSYNAISVGGAKYASPHYVQENWSNWCNPSPIYGPVQFRVSGSGDREMPYVDAPGSQPNEPEGTWQPTNYEWSDNCCHYFNPPADARGTSFSAPLCNGVAACVKSSNGEYWDWPEKVRATILVTAMEVGGGYWNPDSYDQADGAGAISGIDAVTFGQNHTIVNGPNDVAAVNGQFAGYMTTSNQSVPAIFNLAMPSSLPSGKHLRVVLTWDANPDLTTTMRNYLSDLDLYVYNNNSNMLGSSASWDGNVEIVDVPASSCTPNVVYTAEVYPSTIRIPAGARSQGFYYCIAWTWVKDHAP
jgi:hypothetical protein